MPPLLGQQRLESAESKARRTVLALDGDHPDQWIGKQMQALGATVVETRPVLSRHPVNLIALGSTLAAHYARSRSAWLSSFGRFSTAETRAETATRWA